MASSTSLGSRPPSSSQTSAYSSRVSPSATACSTPGTCEVSDGDTGHPLEQLQAVGRAAGEDVDRVLGVGHQPHDVATLVDDAGDVVPGAVEVVPLGVAQHDLLLGHLAEVAPAHVL